MFSTEAEKDLEFPDFGRAPGRQDPKPHQIEAIQAIQQALSIEGHDIRTKCIMACGTGKTLVGALSHEMLGERSLLVEPTLNLIAQNLKVWQANCKPNTKFLVVCSDNSTVELNEDTIVVRPEDISARVTNNIQDIKHFLAGSGPRVIVSTLNSMPLIQQALRDKDITRFDCTVVDEAHNTATAADGRNSLVLDAKAIRSRTRLFMTATEKIYDENDEAAISMDNPKLYGKTCYSLPFSKAIERGLLTDYQVIIAAISDEAARKNIDPRQQKYLRQSLAQLALIRAAKEHGISRVVSYHSLVVRAEEFAETFAKVAKKEAPTLKTWVTSVNGKMEMKVREKILQTLAESPKNMLSIVSNCRCLTEGVDVQALDSVAFVDPRRDEIGIVQAVGRAIRLSTDKTVGSIVIPLIVPKDVDWDTFVAGTEFKKVAQVLRALKAHDEDFVATCKASIEDRSKETDERRNRIVVDNFDLPEDIKKALHLRVVARGAGLKAGMLTKEMIINAARRFYENHKKLPTIDTKEAVPGMDGEKWLNLSQALRLGLRGVAKSGSLSKVLEPLKQELGLDNSLTKAMITEAAKKFYRTHGSLPNLNSTEPVPGMAKDTWAKLDKALRYGNRKLSKGSSLSKLLAPLKLKFGLSKILTEAKIVEAIIRFYRIHHNFPAVKTIEPVPGIANAKWDSLNSSLRLGLRGLPKGGSLAKLLAPLRAWIATHGTLDGFKIENSKVENKAAVVESLNSSKKS